VGKEQCIVDIIQVLTVDNSVNDDGVPPVDGVQGGKAALPQD